MSRGGRSPKCHLASKRTCNVATQMKRKYALLSVCTLFVPGVSREIIDTCQGRTQDIRRGGAEIRKTS